MALSLITNSYHTQLARDLHRAITNTVQVADTNRNTVTPIGDVLTEVVVTPGQSTILGLSYTPGRIEVFVDNQRVSESTYYATTGTSITFVSPFTVVATVIIAKLDIFFVPNPSDYYYAFLGRTLPWVNESVPPDPINTRQVDSEIKRNILGVKRVQPSDVCLLVRRVNWTSGTTYTPWSDTLSINDSIDFYVLTTAFRIYKCLRAPTIDNVVQPSTIMPNEVQPGPFETADGYFWQLLYEIPIADRVKFLTDEFMPVKFFATSTTFDHNAIVDEIVVVNGGTNYTTVPSVLIVGDGTGATAEAILTGQEVSSIVVTNGGGGYSFAKAIVFGGDGFGVEVEVILRSADLPTKINQNVAAYAASTAGAINFVDVIDSGENYSTETTIDVVGDGVGAVLTPQVIDGEIVAVQIEDAGRGYTFADLVVRGDGAFAQLRAVIEPQGGHGSDVPQELLATTLGMTINIEDVLSDFFIDNDFRQVGLLKNPYTYYNTTYFTERTGNACYQATVDSTVAAACVVDDLITSEEGGQFILAAKKDTTLFLLPVFDILSASQRLTNETQGITNISILNLLLPEFSAKKSDVLYVRNMPPVNRVEGQTEQIKFFIRF
jgi:hypothetical protein